MAKPSGVGDLRVLRESELHLASRNSQGPKHLPELRLNSIEILSSSANFGVGGQMVRLAVIFVAFAFSVASAVAANDNLAVLSHTLATVRAIKGANVERDAGPELTPLKHLFREWVEKSFVTLPQNAELEPLAAQLNGRLSAAKLTCDSKPRSARECVDIREGYPEQDDARGYLGSVELSYAEDGRYLVLKTTVGIRCGYDQSAYIYERSGKAWTLLFQNEQDDYREGRYSPQILLETLASPAHTAWNKRAPAPLVLTLGFSPWCQSNWQTIYIRLWRASRSNPTPQPLLDTSDTLYMGNDPATAAASVTADDVLIEYQGGSIDGGVLVRPHVLHYMVHDGDKLERIAPVALDPNAFIEEWLTRPWPESSSWIEMGADRTLIEKAYREHHKEPGLLEGEFSGDARRCRNDRTLWQTQFDFSDKNYKLHDGPYFLERWDAPYRFTLVGIRPKPYAGCDLADPMNDALGTLFPLQGWRR